MKKIILTVLSLLILLSFTACQSTELRDADERSEILFRQMANAEDASGGGQEEPASPTEAAVDIKSEPVHTVNIENIHDWADENRLYNIDGTYDNYERYYAGFAAINEPAELWYGSKGGSPLNESYDPDSAVEFAKAHWNDGLDVCAPFISRCLNAGGLSISSDSSTLLCLKLLNSRLGFGQFVPVNADRTVTLPDYAAPGDVVQVFCPYEGLMNHSLMFVGNDDNKHMKVCCHNLRNSGTYAFAVDRKCYDCTTPITEVFFYHFNRENDDALPAISDDVLLFENTGYAIPDQTYDRAKAAAYARENPLDGIGQFGAEHTSQALSEGGIYVGYPVQTALFMQLMKSRHGAMHSLPINPDRTVTLPVYAEEGDVCFLYCSEEMMVYSSFIIKGADKNGSMLAYSYDKVNNDTKPFLVENRCPSSVCGSDITEIVLYHFERVQSVMS